jgi:hypothetical protein
MELPHSTFALTKTNLLIMVANGIVCYYVKISSAWFCKNPIKNRFYIKSFNKAIKPRF